VKLQASPLTRVSDEAVEHIGSKAYLACLSTCRHATGTEQAQLVPWPINTIRSQQNGLRNISLFVTVIKEVLITVKSPDVSDYLCSFTTRTTERLLVRSLHRSFHGQRVGGHLKVRKIYLQTCPCSSLMTLRRSDMITSIRHTVTARHPVCWS
jgi:hypothetical protein